MPSSKKRTSAAVEPTNVAQLKPATQNPLADIPPLDTGNDTSSRTKIREAVDLTDFSESEGKKLNPEVEKTLLKNQEELSKKASEESKGKNSVESLLVPKTFLFIFVVPPKKVIKWSSFSIGHPLSELPENLHDKAIRCFQTIQRYMGDRRLTKEFRGDNKELQYLANKGLSVLPLRTEVYLQAYKQLNGNPRIESAVKGWEIMCVLINCFLPPGPLGPIYEKFLKANALPASTADKFLRKNSAEVLQGADQHKTKIGLMAYYCWKRYMAQLHSSTKGRFPPLEEVDYYLRAPYRYNVFGETLNDTMKNPDNVDATGKVPKVLCFLAEAVLLLHGHDHEGIFRVPGDLDSVIKLKMKIERGEYTLEGVKDPAIPASLLKMWVRELAEPVIPSEYYNNCLSASSVEEAMEIVDKMPLLNRSVLKYLAKYLQVVGNPVHHEKTKMTVSNLAMVFAPNLLRCPSNNPLDILKASASEQKFIKTIVNYMGE